MAVQDNLPQTAAFRFDDPDHHRATWDSVRDLIPVDVLCGTDVMSADQSDPDAMIRVLRAHLIGDGEEDVMSGDELDIMYAISLLEGNCEGPCDCAVEAYDAWGMDLFSAFLGVLPATAWSVRSATPARQGSSRCELSDVYAPVDLSEIYDALRTTERWTSAELTWDGNVLEASFEDRNRRVDLTLTPLPLEHLPLFYSWMEAVGEENLVEEFQTLDLALVASIMEYYHKDTTPTHPNPFGLFNEFDEISAEHSAVTVEVARGILANWGEGIPELFESAALLAAGQS